MLPARAAANGPVGALVLSGSTGTISLQMCRFKVDLGGADADAGRCRGRAAVGRAFAAGGQAAAGRSGGLGRAAQRPGAVVADRRALGAERARARSAVDRDRDLRAPDGDQAPLRLGLRDAGARGVRLDSLAALLPARTRRPGARRVDGAQAHAPARARGRERDRARVDRQGDAGEAVLRQGGEDRLDRDRGRRPLSDRRGSRGARRSRARAGGPQARQQGRRDAPACAESLAGDGPAVAGGVADDPPPLGRGEGRGAQADRADRAAAGEVGHRGAQARRRGETEGARAWRAGEAACRRAS